MARILRIVACVTEFSFTDKINKHMKNNESLLKSKLAGTMVLLVTAMLWGSSFSVRKIAMEHIGPLAQNAARCFYAGLFTLSAAFVYRKFIKKPDPDEELIGKQIKAGFIVGSCYGLASVFQQTGLMMVQSGKVGFITAMYTVLVPIFLFLIFREKIRGQVRVGMVLSFAELYCVTSGSFGFEWGYLLLFIESILFAFQIIVAGKFVHKNDPVVLITVQCFLGFLYSVIAAMIVHEPFAWHMIGDAFWPTVYTGIVCLGVANAMQFIGQKMVPSAVAATICSFESVFGLMFGIIVLHERMTGLQLFGCFLLFAAVIISQWEFSHRFQRNGNAYYNHTFHDELKKMEKPNCSKNETKAKKVPKSKQKVSCVIAEKRLDMW